MHTPSPEWLNSWFLLFLLHLAPKGEGSLRWSRGGGRSRIIVRIGDPFCGRLLRRSQTPLASRGDRVMQSPTDLYTELLVVGLFRIGALTFAPFCLIMYLSGHHLRAMTQPKQNDHSPKWWDCRSGSRQGGFRLLRRQPQFAR